MINWSAPLTKRDAVVIASRLASLYFLAWAISSLLYCLKDLYSVHFFFVWAAHTGSSYDAYLRSEEIQYLSIHIIEAGLTLLSAGWVYRCGPGIIGFFFPDTEQSTSES